MTWPTNVSGHSGRQPWQVTCPSCGQQPGWPCKDSTGAPLVGSYHGTRTDYGRR